MNTHDIPICSEQQELFSDVEPISPEADVALRFPYQTSAVTASVIGGLYSIILAGSLVSGVKILSPPEAPDTHYLLNSIAWIAGIGIAARLAALLSRTFRTAVGVIAAIPASLVWIALIMQSDSRLPALAFGWEPPAFAFGAVLLVLSLVAGIVGGASAESMSFEDSTENSITKYLGQIRPRHWWWLWFPMSSWAGMLPTVAYLFWLTLATAWYWMVHPSLWFNWRWFLFLSFGAVFTYLPFSALATGVQEAFAVLAEGRKRHLRPFQVGLRFLGWGYGCAMLGSIVLSFVAFWILSKLPVAGTSSKPWWMFF
jgi:hypothetical protein